MKNINYCFATMAAVFFFTGCASSIPQRDLKPELAKSRGYFLTRDEVHARGGMGQYAPMVCTKGGWGLPVDCASVSSQQASTPAVAAPVAMPVAVSKDEMLAAKYDAKKTIRFYFDTAKSTLTADDQEKLNQLKASKVFIIRGFADARGNSAINQKLSLNRAHQVMTHLKQRGFNIAGANIAGLGAISGATNGAAATEARRVEVIFE